MHYYVTGADNPIVPWTKEMFRRFHERNGYDLRPRLPDLFFDVSAESARIRHDFYETLTAFYSDAYYRQIHDWCREHDVLFTGHLFEEWLRNMVRVEGNPFRHCPHLDVTGVDHLYPIIGSRDRPAEHVAIKLASSAAHQLGSERLLCESFGGIFMDTTMQRMKWITDWEYVLGVNLLNPTASTTPWRARASGTGRRRCSISTPWWHVYDEFSLRCPAEPSPHRRSTRRQGGDPPGQPPRSSLTTPPDSAIRSATVPSSTSTRSRSPAAPPSRLRLPG